ncbi:MAG: DNA mismatch repair endonuclease MutL [Pirellula sp.]|jgi:DNA mismatch repair protein MutL
MPTIRKLPVGLVNKIAAGEVIERPASVVKELLENSIDAGSKRVEISIEGGGLDLIRISDNGCGIDAEQLELAISPHATSKLQNDEDLFDVRTLGFRGEALASIAEISHMTLRSRTTQSDSAYELLVKGGVQEPVRPTSGPVGTTIEIRHLFFNTPVRRKFMKSAQTEMGHVIEAFTRVALAFPSVHMVLNSGSRTVHDLPPTERWSERIRKFFGDEVADTLISIDQRDDKVAIHGYVCDPSVSRSNNRMQYLFLNGRHIRDKALQHALGESYRGLLMVGRMPVCFLHVDIDPKTVDVNVHPTKVEVRFEDSGAIYTRLLSGLRNKFLNSDFVPAARPTAEPILPSMVPSASSDSMIPSLQRSPASTSSLLDWPQTTTAALPRAVPDFQPYPSARTSFGAPTSAGSHHNDPFGSIKNEPTRAHSELPSNASVWSAQSDLDDPSSASLSPESFAHSDASVHRLDHSHTGPSSTRPSGFQIHNRYLVSEYEDGMVIIDQHALHERIIFEQIKAKVLSKAVDVQRLLVPETVSLPPQEAALVTEYKTVLDEIGLQVEPFGGETFLIHSYPAMLKGISPVEVLRQVLEPLLKGGKKPDVRDLLDEMMNMMACKAAVKAGDKLSNDEISELLKQRDMYQETHHCPHGRPTALFFSRDQLDKMFKRI